MSELTNQIINAHGGLKRWMTLQQGQGLRVRFPGSIATHSEVQDFYFDRDFLLRRHDYSVDVAGGFVAAQYVHDYIEADGIRLPTKRRAFRLGPDNQALTDNMLVSIDLSDIHFS
ncbi:hypothetical protein [Metapseudomonas boanensis]|uniref:Uncharacterized protein n=1 Tax=Metapseudomonas boanensis TaxID=2822138 RepID=A0ABS5XIE1_9GAMM|nr:hypothetical protein [Pseudomonas boanensis]MBT8767457.1 hypothetical protein [Pseudomonas boanensis]